MSDHTEKHRENASRNLARIEASITKAHADHEQILAGMRKKHDILNRNIHQLQGLLSSRVHDWTEDDRQELERLLAKRHRLALLMHKED